MIKLIASLAQLGVLILNIFVKKNADKEKLKKEVKERVGDAWKEKDKKKRASILNDIVSDVNSRV